MSTDKTILFVDDNPMSIQIYQSYMENAPFRCLFASSPKEALNLISEYQISGIISDLSMPDMSGIDLLKEVNIKIKNCLKILVTGNTDLHSILYAVNEIGVHKVFLKPLQINGEQIQKIISEYFEEV